jgi:hypothetical protein
MNIEFQAIGKLFFSQEGGGETGKRPGFYANLSYFLKPYGEGIKGFMI